MRVPSGRCRWFPRCCSRRCGAHPRPRHTDVSRPHDRWALPSSLPCLWPPRGSFRGSWGWRPRSRRGFPCQRASWDSRIWGRRGRVRSPRDRRRSAGRRSRLRQAPWPSGRPGGARRECCWDPRHVRSGTRSRCWVRGGVRSCARRSGWSRRFQGKRQWWLRSRLSRVRRTLRLCTSAPRSCRSSDRVNQECVPLRRGSRISLPRGRFWPRSLRRQSWPRRSSGAAGRCRGAGSLWCRQCCWSDAGLW